MAGAYCRPSDRFGQGAVTVRVPSVRVADAGVDKRLVGVVGRCVVFEVAEDAVALALPGAGRNLGELSRVSVGVGLGIGRTDGLDLDQVPTEVSLHGTDHIARRGGVRGGLERLDERAFDGAAEVSARRAARAGRELDRQVGERFTVDEALQGVGGLFLGLGPGGGWSTGSRAARDPRGSPRRLR